MVANGLSVGCGESALWVEASALGEICALAAIVSSAMTRTKQRRTDRKLRVFRVTNFLLEGASCMISLELCAISASSQKGNLPEFGAERNTTVNHLEITS
jgi:hypothetical protein